MELTLKDFNRKGEGWYLKLNGTTIAVIIPGDLPELVKHIQGYDNSEVERIVNEFYSNREKELEIPF